MEAQKGQQRGVTTAGACECAPRCGCSKAGLLLLLLLLGQQLGLLCAPQVLLPVLVRSLQ
jgi:hypothetical protein